MSAEKAKVSASAAGVVCGSAIVLLLGWVLAWSYRGFGLDLSRCVCLCVCGCHESESGAIATNFEIGVFVFSRRRGDRGAIFPPSCPIKPASLLKPPGSFFNASVLRTLVCCFAFLLLSLRSQESGLGFSLPCTAE